MRISQKLERVVVFGCDAARRSLLSGGKRCDGEAKRDSDDSELDTYSHVSICSEDGIGFGQSGGMIHRI